MDVKGVSQGGQNYFATNSSPNTEVEVSQTIDTSIKVLKPDITIKVDGNEDKKIGEKDIQKAVDKLNKLFEGTSTHVESETVGKTRRVCIRIVNTETKEVIRELPPKKIVEMIDKLCEMAGIMVDERA